jgi:glycosyltransferase involved in cell wall biosynthesis
MTVSVIVPTYNGAHKISGVINALRGQDFKAFELIIVIDGSTDDTEEVLGRMDLSFAPTRIIKQENSGRAAVRNRGAGEASGELLIFFDDDMLPLANCIEGHVHHHIQNPDSILTGGLREPVNASSPDIMKYRAYLSNKWNTEIRSIDGKLGADQIFITAANFSIRKHDFQALQGFDERLNDAEDFDFAVRAYKAAIPLYFKEEVFAWHHDQLTCVSYVKRQRQYLEANKKLSVIKPWIYAEGYRKPIAQPIGWRRIVYSLFCNKLFVSAVDRGAFSILPTKVKYLLYDLIISANGIFFPEKVKL